MKIHIHGFVNFSWFMKITGKEFHGNFMTKFSTMKSEIAVFMAMKKVHGFFNKFSWDFHEKEICSVSGCTLFFCFRFRGYFPLIFCYSKLS